MNYKTYKEKRDSRLYREYLEMIEAYPEDKGEIYKYLMKRYEIFSLSTIYNIIRKQSIKQNKK